MSIKAKVFNIAEKNKLLMNAYRLLSQAQIKMRRNMTDEQYIRLRYKQAFGKELNLDNPRTFNEKIQWLKLHDRKPQYTIMVDKYLAKEYIASIVGSEYVIPTLGRWDRFEDINFDALPDKFVLKCNHDCGSVYICRDKNTFDYKQVGKMMNKALKLNYYWGSREWPYKDVKPCIMAEKYMEDGTTHDLKDYKFFCFDGVVRALFIATDRQRQGVDTKFDFFDADFNHLSFSNGHPNAIPMPEKPKSFDRMKELAEKLSKDIPLLRVDFYEVDGHPYVGELTFAHWNGLVPFEPEEWDYIFGNWITLPVIMSNEK